MEKKLSKSEFMQKVVNDRYKKQRAEKEKLEGADRYTFDNMNKSKNFRRK
ncbi:MULTISPECIES: hypothetical protein [unclassified Clostridium]|nr:MULTISPECIES: hypothetical protein [unclassified Clostridium]